MELGLPVESMTSLEVEIETQTTPEAMAELIDRLLAQKPWIVPIPGTTKPHRLEENIGALAIDLSASDLHEITGLATQVTVQGSRYSEQQQKMVDR